MPPKKVKSKANKPNKRRGVPEPGTTADTPAVNVVATREERHLSPQASPASVEMAVDSPVEPLPSPAPQTPVGVESEIPPPEPPAPTMTMEERQAKLDQLRSKMRSSLQANRKDLVEESTKARTTARDIARHEKQKRLAEVLREKIDAEERGEDVDRKKNWEYSIEENDEWEKRQARKKRRSNFEFNDYEDAARRRYKKDIDALKPDLEAYEKQKSVTFGTSSSALAASADLYRDSNSLIYADNNPSEDAIDKVVAKINLDVDRRRNFSKTRVNEVEGDITYINEANRVFNKKIDRYYNKYTAEIRANFERGTAL